MRFPLAPLLLSGPIVFLERPLRSRRSRGYIATWNRVPDVMPLRSPFGHQVCLLAVVGSRPRIRNGGKKQ